MGSGKDIIIRGYTPKRKGKKNGKEYDYYYVQIVCIDSDGNTTRESHSIGKVTSKAVARDEMNKLLEAKRAELKVYKSIDEDGRIIFLDSFKEWLRSKKGTVQDNTYDGYVVRSKAIIRYFEQLTEARGVEAIYLDEIRPVDILDFYNYELTSGRVNPKAGEKKGVSRDTVLSYAGLLHNYYKQMLMEENVTANICDVAEVPRVKVDNTRTKNYMSLEQIRDFMNVLKGMSASDQRLIPIVKICLSYGLRRSEMMAIKWDVVDFEHDTLEIKRTAVRGNGKVYYKDNTKTPSSHRVYPLTNPIRTELIKIKNNQISMGCYQKDGLVCIDVNSGKPYSPDYMSKLFKKVVKKCTGIPNDYHFHDMRKTCTSLLLESGDWDLDLIQLWIGHENSKDRSNNVLFDRYLTLTMKWKRDKVASIEKIYKGIF